MIDLPTQETIEDYRTALEQQVAQFSPHIHNITKKHFEKEKIILIEDCAEFGTSPTCIVTFETGLKLVFKFFSSEFFAGYKCFCKELAIFDILEQSPFLKTKTPLFYGCGDLASLYNISSEENWYYLIVSFFQGKTARVLRDEKINAFSAIAKEIAPIITNINALQGYEKHEHVLSAKKFDSFLQKQRTRCIENHQKAKILSPAMIQQIPSYINRFFNEIHKDAIKVFIHADMHEDHVFLVPENETKFVIEGVIDFGDARVGSLFYELQAIHFGLLRGQKQYLKEFLDHYQWNSKHPIPYDSPDFSYFAMCYSLLHKFNIFDAVKEQIECLHSLEQIEQLLWQV